MKYSFGDYLHILNLGKISWNNMQKALNISKLNRLTLSKLILVYQNTQLKKMEPIHRLGGDICNENIQHKIQHKTIQNLYLSIHPSIYSEYIYRIVNWAKDNQFPPPQHHMILFLWQELSRGWALCQFLILLLNT